MPTDGLANKAATALTGTSRLRAMTGQPTARTKADIALHAIRERILSGELQPGDRVRPDALTAELEMSPTPIREALRLLQADRLVHYEPHHGIVVARLSSKEIEDIYLVRSLLEPVAS